MNTVPFHSVEDISSARKKVNRLSADSPRTVRRQTVHSTPAGPVPPIGHCNLCTQWHATQLVAHRCAFYDSQFVRVQRPVKPGVPPPAVDPVRLAFQACIYASQGGRQK